MPTQVLYTKTLDIFLAATLRARKRPLSSPLSIHRERTMSSRPANQKRDAPHPPGLSDPAQRDELDGLLLAAARRDTAAFETLYRRTSPKIFAICMRMLRDRHESEDTLQDVFVTAWRQAATFDPQLASAVTWLGTIARNRAIDRLRHHRTHPLDEANIEEIADEAATPAALAQLSQERRRLEQCLQGLPHTQQKVVKEAFYTGCSYAEMAARLSVPLGTMKSWIRRSLIQLKLCLEK